MIRRSITAIFCLLLLVQGTSAAEKLKLTADHIKFSDNRRTMVASSNVVIDYAGVTINTQQAKINIDTNEVWGTHNVSIKRASDTIDAAAFHYKLNTDEIDAQSVTVAIRPRDIATGNVYMSVSRLHDTAEAKTGTNGFVTTCDLDDPHYFVWAEKFTYTPNQRIVGSNVFIYSPIGFLPFGYWMPTYIYELGKRNIIYLVPQIGQNEVEGWFVRNTFDYYFGKDKRGEAYVDWIQKKGFGLGVSHHYDLNEATSGNAYIYGLPEPNHTANYALKWDQEVELDTKLKLFTAYSSIDKYSLNSAFRESRSRNAAALSYQDSGDIRRFDIENNQDNSNKTQRNQLKFMRQMGSLTEWNLSYLNEDTSFSRIQTSQVMQNTPIEGGLQLQNNITYSDNRKRGEKVSDELLKTDTKISKKWTEYGTGMVNFTAISDTDKGAFTEPLTRIQIERQPELSFTANDKIFQLTPSWKLTVKQKGLLGHYREIYYIPSALREREIIANRYGIENAAIVDIPNLPITSNIQLRGDYNQYGYDNFGDKLYQIKQSHTLKTIWNSFIQTEVGYKREFAAGNSPFMGLPGEPSITTYNAGTPRYASINEISETLSFYWEEVSKYHWSHTYGFDWEKNNRKDYSTELYIRPTDLFLFSVATGFIFEENRINATDKFSPLNSNLSLTPTKNVALILDHQYNLNKGKTDRLNATTRFLVGDVLDDQWEFESVWQHNPLEDTFRIESLRAIKHMHCRMLTFGWTRSLNEFRFTYTIEAFPSDQIGFSSNENESFKLQGVLDDQAQDRF